MPRTMTVRISRELYDKIDLIRRQEAIASFPKAADFAILKKTCKRLGR